MKIITDTKFRELEKELGSRIQYTYIYLGGLMINAILPLSLLDKDRPITCPKLLEHAINNKEEYLKLESQRVKK